MEWAEARKRVEQPCLDVLVQWRGDDDDDGELEDILREVIVISDDEDNEEEMQQGAGTHRGHRKRSESVEFISADALHTQPIDYATVNSRAGQDRSPSPDSDVHTVEYLGAAPLIRSRPFQYNQHRLEQMGAHRHRIWEEAVSRQRKHPDIIYAGNGRLASPTLKEFDEDRSQLLPETRDSRQQIYETKRLERNPYPAHARGDPAPLPAPGDQITNDHVDSSEGPSRFTQQVSLPSLKDADSLGLASL